MIRYALAAVAALVFGFSANAADHHHKHHQHHQHRHGHHQRHHNGFGGHRIVQHHYNFRFHHRPAVVLYGSYPQYQQFGFAVVGYNNYGAVQGLCAQHGLQIVQVNPVQNFVVVRLPGGYGWNSLVGFSRHHGVRFIEPGFRHY